MCGIAGQYNFRDQRPVAAETLRAMTRSINHRGPDDEGFYFSRGLGLGFRRLSIIDLEGGHQPMSDHSETVWVVFNGEIYNHAELRGELAGHGHVFRTKSDTEVIVHGYKQWGLDVFSRLNGMFGLAIWDETRQRLTLARDSAGIKLIYYRVDDGSVTFGSEVRAVRAATQGRPGIDPVALNLFLRYRYTPSPLTLYQGVHKLAPGTMAVFEGGQFTITRWYRPASDGNGVPTSDEEAAEELLAIYKRALKRHLISDVPLGLLLSGGIDSGLLLGLMSLYGERWPTYTVGYGRSNYEDDELADAAVTASLFGAANHQVQLTQREFEQALPRIVSVLEEPVATSSIVPMYFVCERARADVKVALVGQGPDELFGGYARHVGVRYGALWRGVPQWLRSGLEAAIQRLPRANSLKRGIYALGTADQMRRYQNVFSIMPGQIVDGLFRRDALPEGAGDRVLDIWSDLAPEMAGKDELGAFQVLEIRSSLPDELLMYADKLSMAHGLEARVPYLDKEVVDFAMRLPAAFKIRNGQQKWLHRRACERFLPSPILKRKKRGFAVNVVDRWFHGSMSSKLTEYLLDQESLMYQYLSADSVRALLDGHRSRRQDNHKILFSLVVLEEWLRASAASNA